MAEMVSQVNSESSDIDEECSGAYRDRGNKDRDQVVDEQDQNVSPINVPGSKQTTEPISLADYASDVYLNENELLEREALVVNNRVTGQDIQDSVEAENIPLSGKSEKEVGNEEGGNVEVRTNSNNGATTVEKATATEEATGESKCFPNGWDDGIDCQSVPPIFSPSTLEHCLAGEFQLNPIENMIHWIRDYEDNSVTSPVQKQAHDLFKQFLMKPETLERTRAHFNDVLCSFLVSSKSLHHNREASEELLRQFKFEDVHSLVGRHYMLQFLDTLRNMEVGKEQKISSNDATGSCEQMETDNHDVQGKESSNDDEIKMESGPCVPLNVSLEPLHPSDGSMISSMEGGASAGPSQSSTKHMLKRKKSFLQEKLRGGVLKRAHAEISRYSDSERGEKIKAAGKIFFTAIFTPKEILEGNVSGKKTNKNEKKCKYDVRKVATISALIAWLLKNPQDIRLSTFRKYQATSSNKGLVGVDYKISFRKAVLVDFANLQRAELKAMMKKKEALGPAQVD